MAGITRCDYHNSRRKLACGSSTYGNKVLSYPQRRGRRAIQDDTGSTAEALGAVIRNNSAIENFDFRTVPYEQGHGTTLFHRAESKLDALCALSYIDEVGILSRHHRWAGCRGQGEGPRHTRHQPPLSGDSIGISHNPVRRQRS